MIGEVVKVVHQRIVLIDIDWIEVGLSQFSIRLGMLSSEGTKLTIYALLEVISLPMSTDKDEALEHTITVELSHVSANVLPPLVHGMLGVKHVGRSAVGDKPDGSALPRRLGAVVAVTGGSRHEGYLMAQSSGLEPEIERVPCRGKHDCEQNA